MMQWWLVQITNTKVWINQLYNIRLYYFDNIVANAICIVLMGKVSTSKGDHEIDTCLLAWSMRKNMCDFEGGKRMYIE